MKRFQHLLVYLDLTDTDRLLAEAASRVAEMAGAESITLFHVLEDPDFPAGLAEKYPWLKQPLRDQVSERLDAISEELQAKVSAKVRIELQTGKSIIRILKHISESDTDLILIARHSADDQRPVRLTRKATCSVMTVPEDATIDFRKILIASDFSKASQSAVDFACAFAEAQDVPTVDVVHSYTIPKGHQRASVTREEIAADVEKYCRAAYEESLKSSDTHGRELTLHLVDQPLAVTAVNQVARKLEAGLIVIGSRGRDTLASLLLGSNAEAILHQAPAPTLAVKPKGSGQTLLQAILAND